MKAKAIIFILLLSFLYLGNSLFAQSTLEQNSRIYCTVGKNNLGLPFKNLFQPTLGIGVEAGWIKPFKNKKRMAFTSFIGGYLKDQDSAFHLGAELSHRYPLGEKWTIGFAYGVGYLHSFNSNKVFNIEDAADWKERNHLGVSTALIRGGLWLDYQLDKMSFLLKIYEGFQIPYTQLLPAAIRSSVQIGVSFDLQ